LHAGYIAWWDKVASEDALTLQILRRAGAVFHARTTEPQSVMQLETDSNLYGITTNPYNRDLSAGGSSGGEGALIALGGSCLGIGTDVGGKNILLLGKRHDCSSGGSYGYRQYPGSGRCQRHLWAQADSVPDSNHWLVVHVSWSGSDTNCDRADEFEPRGG
jgi:amidase